MCPISLRKLSLACLVLPVFISVSFLASASDITSKLTGKPSTATKAGAADEFLDPTAAFKPTLRQRDPFTAELKVDIAPGYYLYRDRIQVEHLPDAAELAKKSKTPSGAGTLRPKAVETRALLALSPPAGKSIDDPTFGNVVVYENTAVIPVDLLRFGTQKAQTINIAVTSQGCAKAGVCFPAYKQLFALKLDPKGKLPGTWVIPNPKAIRVGAPPAPPSPATAAKAK
jgi:thioredoxin:protein disulfide reductase